MNTCTTQMGVRDDEESIYIYIYRVDVKNVQTMCISASLCLLMGGAFIAIKP